jgi:hypothetical protein
MPNLKRFWLPIALAAALAARPLAPAEEGKGRDAPPKKEVTTADLKEQLDRMEGVLGTAVADLRGDLAALRKDVDQLNKLHDLSRAKTDSDIRLLQSQVSSLEERINARLGRLETQIQTQMSRADGINSELAQLRKQVSERTTRTAAAPPTDTGTVRVHNTFTRPVSVVVNGRVYRDIPPGPPEVLTPVPAGPVTYEVLGIQGPVTSSVEAGRTLTINVYTRPTLGPVFVP